MCGILAYSGLNRPFHHRLLESLRRRGPDAIGFWADDRVQIGHTRLAIIGLDNRSTEPLENDTHVLAYNGEIYNFHDIKRRLESAGVQTHGANDAEVLLHAWGVWGPAILRDLTGFWAFALYDKKARKLYLVRDQFGIKPLYYRAVKGSLCVASRIRTILEVVPEAHTLYTRTC